MAYGSAEISAADLALAAADNPLGFGSPYLRNADDVDWRQSGSFGSGSDDPHEDGPTLNAYDDWDHVRTYPASAQNTWHFLVDQGADNLAIIDSFLLKNHNLGTIGATVALEFDQNQNGNFSAVDTVASESPSTDKRLCWLDLHHTGSNPRRYSDVRYWRLKFTGTSIQPKFGEVVIGRRRQLKTGPVVGHDPTALSSRVAVFESDSGVDSVYVFNKKRQSLVATFRMHEDAYIDDWENLFDTDQDGGTLPFVWVAKPNTSPTDALWMRLLDPSLNGPRQGWSERRFSISAVEKGPNFLAVGVGL